MLYAGVCDTIEVHAPRNVFRGIRPRRFLKLPHWDSSGQVSGSPGRLKMQIPKWTAADYYGAAMGLIFAPYFMVIYIFIFIFSIPLLCLTGLYSLLQPKPTPRLKRHFGFFIFSCICAIANIPIFIFAGINAFLMFILSIVFGLPFGIFYLGMPKIVSNFKVLYPYFTTGPWSWMDVLCAIIGAQYRQHFLEFVKSFTVMLTLDPYLKYFLICNPFYHNLDLRFANQWTESMDYVSNDVLYEGLKRSVAYAIHLDAVDDSIDDDRFAAHYQFPSPATPDRLVPNLEPDNVLVCQGAVGYQYTATVSHFTFSNHPPKGKYKPKSSTGETLIFCVVLYYLNPFHCLTGYVEVNTTPKHALEHPMWCVQGDNHFATAFYDSVSELFFAYAPEISEDVIQEEFLLQGKPAPDGTESTDAKQDMPPV